MALSGLSSLVLLPVSILLNHLPLHFCIVAVFNFLCRPTLSPYVRYPPCISQHREALVAFRPISASTTAMGFLSLLVAMLALIFKIITWPAWKVKDCFVTWRESRHWKEPKDLDIEIGEIRRVERWEAANPRLTDEQTVEARNIWYQERRRHPSWVIVPSPPAYKRGIGTQDNVNQTVDTGPSREGNTPTDQPPLRCDPELARPLTLAALQRLDRVQFLPHETSPLSIRNGSQLFSNALAVHGSHPLPNTFENAQKISPTSIYDGIHGLNPRRYSDSEVFRLGCIEQNFAKRRLSDIEEVEIHPTPAIPLRWGDEWPQPMPIQNPLPQTRFFKRIVGWEVGSPESPGADAEEWQDVDLS